MKAMTIKQVSVLVLVMVFAGCAAINRMTGVSETRELQKMGQPATATILQIWDTGMTLNNDPVVSFLLEIHRDGVTPYQAKTKCPINRLDIPQIQPGKTVPVRFDPNDPTRVALDLYQYR